MSAPSPIGRDQLLRRLVPLPVCSLIKAPSSTGKRTVAHWLADEAGIPRVDQRFVPASYWVDERGRHRDPSYTHSDALRLVEPELTVEMVRQTVAWIRTAPRTAAGRVVIMRLDHERADGSSWVASTRAMTSLLKTLEEPPASARFILLTSGSVLPTIESRCVVAPAGLLSVDEVAEILYRVSDLDQSSSRQVAALGSGRVAPALAAASGAVGVKESVLGLLGDLASGDADAAISRAREWTDAATLLLVTAAHEKMTNRFVVFTSEELSRLPLSRAAAMLSVVRRCSGARPRLLVGALVSALS